MTFIFKNKTIFWDIPKQNRGQTKWDGGSIRFAYEKEKDKQVVYEEAILLFFDEGRYKIVGAFQRV